MTTILNIFRGFQVQYRTSWMTWIPFRRTLEGFFFNFFQRDIFHILSALGETVARVFTDTPPRTQSLNLYKPEPEVGLLMPHHEYVTYPWR